MLIRWVPCMMSRQSKKTMGEYMAEDRPASKRREQIDANLKRVYDDVLKQDIPDRFKDLLAQLKQRDESKKEGGEE